MIENISNLVVAAAAVIGAITAAILAGMAIWTFRDIRSRSRDVLVQVLATVMVAVIPVAGILVYFMLRPRETLAEAYVRALEEESLLASIEHQEFCPSCGRRVDNDMQYCPSCHTKLRNPCPKCGRAVHLSWDLCAYCGTTLAPELPVIKKPATRQIPQPQAAPASRLAQPNAAWQLQSPAAAAEPVERISAKAAIGGFLDKVGGAIEGVVDRLSATKPQADSAPESEQEDADTRAETRPETRPETRLPERPPARQAAERLAGELHTAQPARRTPPKIIPRPPGQGSTQPTRPVDPGQNGQSGNTSGTSPIKPLISRDEPLE